MAVMITGVGGQDGSYLAEQLVANGQQVIGVVHPHEPQPAYLDTLRKTGSCELVPCDLADPAAFRLLLRHHSPARVYHLAAVANPRQCALKPELSHQVNVISVEVLNDWVRRDMRDARVLVVSSVAVFGRAPDVPQGEATPAAPTGEYAVQKQAVRELAAAARKDGLFFACAIPFHHESPRRTEDYVFAKVCRAAARIAKGEQRELSLGNASARRDWGYAPEYVTAMTWMLDVEAPHELILATGESHSVDELVDAAFAAAGVDHGGCVHTDETLMRVDDPQELRGDASRAWDELGWEAGTKFQALIELMVEDALASNQGH
jgi:GDPmannose 4,6-dehydratase